MTITHSVPWLDAYGDNLEPCIANRQVKDKRTGRWKEVVVYHPPVFKFFEDYMGGVDLM